MKWTDSEKEVLKQMCEDGASLSDMAKVFNRTESNMRSTIKRFKYTRKLERKPWSNKEIKQFKEDWHDSTLSYNALAKKYNRSKTALQTEATRLKLGARLYDDSYITIPDICEEMQVSKDRVYTWIRNGLKTKKSKVKPYKYLIDTKDLLDFLEKHPTYYDASKISGYLFSVEPNWLKQKRQNDSGTFIRKMGIKYSDEELHQIIYLFKHGDSNEQIAEKVKRTPFAIEKVLGDLGLSRRRYNDYEIKFIRDNVAYMTINEIAKNLPLRTKAGIIAKCEQLGIKYHSNPADNKQSLKEDTKK